MFAAGGEVARQATFSGGGKDILSMERKGGRRRTCEEAFRAPEKKERRGTKGGERGKEEDRGESAEKRDRRRTSQTRIKGEKE